MEIIANRLLLKTNTEYELDGSRFFIVLGTNEEPLICSSEITPNDWKMLLDNAQFVKENNQIVISDDPDYYPDGYLDITNHQQYFIDENDMLMPNFMWELEDRVVSDWINENAEQIDVFNQSVYVDSDMCESMGIFDDISSSLYEECLNNEHPDIVEFFDSDDSKVSDWVKENNQTPINLLIDSTGHAIRTDDNRLKLTESITEYVFTVLLSNPEKTTKTFHDLFNGIFEIINK